MPARSFKIFSIFVILLILTVSCIKQSADGYPNIVLILADDPGYSDIGCYGGDIETPNLDHEWQKWADRCYVLSSDSLARIREQLNKYP